MEQLPPCEATGPDGARLVIHPHDLTDSVADLARALDLPVTTPLAIDDRAVSPHLPLIETGLGIGSTVTIAPEPASTTTTTTTGTTTTSSTPALQTSTDHVVVAISVGPACARATMLAPGRHTVGRSTSATIRIADPTVELHHGLLDVTADGTVTFTQLSGAFPVTVDGRPCRAAHPIEGALSIGNSRIVITPTSAGSVEPTSAGSIAPAANDPWRRVVRRGPQVRNRDAPEALVVPEPPTGHRAPPLTTLVGAGIAALGAGVLAAVLGQALFALFAAIGAIASLTTWGAGALIARRDRRRAERAHRSSVATFEAALASAHRAADRAHRMEHLGVVDVLEVIHGDAGALWSRRCGPGEAMTATIGRGACHWQPPIANDDRRRLSAATLLTVGRREWLEDVAVPLLLEPSSVIAVRGAPLFVDAVCRSVIVQLAALYGPADWELQVVTDDVRRWDWIGWLPHARRRPCVVDATAPTELIQAFDGLDEEFAHRRRTVILVDAPSLLSVRTGPLRRRLSRGDVSCIALIAPDVSVPAIVDRILEVGDTGTARWTEATGSAWATGDREIAIAGISRSTAEAAARRLAPLLDPEDDDGSGRLPTSLSLAELDPVEDAAALARRWALGGSDPAPIARLGVSADGVVDVDLVRDGPHGLVAGTTGSGKSELLRTLVVSLAAQSSPDHLTMILVDYKGGSTFDACARLPHTVGVVTDLDDGLAERVLVSLEAELRRRERLLRDVGVDDLTAYRRAVVDPLARLVVVIDEFASLARELPGFLDALVSIAQRGRSLGIHLLLATQRPAGVVTDDIRANTNLRIALRLQDRADANDVVGDVTPSQFPVGVPGRAALRLGPEELVVFQTAASSSPARARSVRLWVERAGAGSAASGADPSALERLVDTIRHAACLVGTSRPHRPWMDALPPVVGPRDLGEVDAVGLLDDPAEQCRRPLRWEPDDGSLLLVGAIGSGTTTAAVTVVAASLRRAAPDELHLYVIDAQGETAWTILGSSAHCGAVVRVSETERLGRLLGRLVDVLDQRALDATREPVIVLAIDGFAAVRDSLVDLAHGEAARRLDRVLRDGPAHGVVAVITTDGLSAAGLALPRAATWVFHVGDQAAARTAGLRAPTVRAGVPGRLRVAESGLEGQVALLEPPCSRDSGSVGTTGRAAPVEVLPELVSAGEFDDLVAAGAPSSPREGLPIELPIGVAADDLEPAFLRVPAGDHVFVGGAARTGRSTALRQVEVAWRRVHLGGLVLHVDRRRPISASDLERIDDHPAVLVVVDDAERVEDPGGTFGLLLGRPAVTFAVAARPDAVRVAYGHWTRDVTRSRCGLIMTSAGDVDGELLGATLPRRSTIPARPGLAWVIDHRGQRLVQVAARMPP